MPTLLLTDEQVIDLVKQLPAEQQRAVYEFLLHQRWPAPGAAAAYYEEGARVAAAARGHDWDTMSDEEQISFVDDLVHEDRQCGR